MDKDRLRDKFRGALLGVAIGDSLGAGLEGYYTISEPIPNELSPQYTDDTAMTIGVAESLIRCKCLNPDDICTQFIKNYEREPWRGYALGPPRIFQMIKNGYKCSDELDKLLFPGGSYGNGSAMRSTPIGLYYFSCPPETIREKAYICSAITHSHSLAKEGSALIAYSVSLAVRDEINLLEKLFDFAQLEEYKKKIILIEQLIIEKHDRYKISRALGNGVEAHNSVSSAIYSFIACNTFEESVKYAVSLGGDTDTIGAMCGGIAGAKYGMSGIPSKWVKTVENKEYLIYLADKLLESCLSNPETVTSLLS